MYKISNIIIQLCYNNSLTSNYSLAFLIVYEWLWFYFLKVLKAC